MKLACNVVWFVLVDWIAACLGGCCVMWFGFWDLLGLILGLGCGDFVVRFIVKLVLGVRVGVWWVTFAWVWFML